MSESFTDELFIVAECILRVPPIYRLRVIKGISLRGHFNRLNFKSDILYMRQDRSVVYTAVFGAESYDTKPGEYPCIPTPRYE